MNIFSGRIPLKDYLNKSDNNKADKSNKTIINFIKKYKYLFLIIIIAVTLSAGVWFYTNTYHPMEIATKTLQQEDVYINEYDWLICEAPQKTNRGFIFYPGGNVEPEAYLPLANKIADLGFKTVIIPMPFNLAVFNSDAALEAFNNFSNITDWYICGHSLGGVMAAKFAGLHTHKIKGFILMAAYPQESKDLSRTGLPVLSITASNDNILDHKKYEARKKLLPELTQYVEIKGGNHSQFGWYGFQKGDGQATITRNEQLNKVTKHIKDFTEQLPH